MDKQKEILFLLVKSAVNGEPYSLTDEVDVQSLYNYAKRHNVVTLVSDGAYNCGLDLNGKLDNKFFKSFCAETMMSEKQRYALKEMTTQFEKNGIDFMCLKGSKLKEVYLKAEHRTMSDLDVLIKKEQYGKIQTIMRSLGYKFDKESDHEYIWNKGSICVELHKRIIPSYNEDYYSYFGEGWQFAKKRENSDCEYEMSVEDEFVFIFTHLCKHYRDSGVGLRQFIDIGVYINRFPQMDGEYVKEKMIKLKIYEFYLNVVKTLKVWFDNGDSDEITDFITDVAFGGGEVNQKDASLISDALKRRKKGKTVKQIKRQKIKNSIFIPYKTLCNIYPVLRKCVILTPFIWVYHIFRRIFTKGRLKEYNQELALIQDSKIDDYKKSLNFVGLDYNFDDINDKEKA